MVKLFSFLLFGWLTFYITTPSYAITVIPVDNKYFKIIDDRGVVTKDITISYIRKNAQKYKSAYWKRVYEMAKQSEKAWRKGKGLK